MKGARDRDDRPEGRQDPDAKPATAQPAPPALTRSPADLAGHSAAGRASAVAALSASAGNHAVTQWLARQPTQAPAGTAAPSEALTEDDLEAYDAEIEFYKSASNYEDAELMLMAATEDAEAAFWMEVMDDATFRAFHFRCARILEYKHPTTKAEMEAVLDKVEEWAAEEAETLKITGQSELREHAWAFPETWANLVDSTLKPPRDLDPFVAQANEKAETQALGEIAARFPKYIYDHGLPVPFAEALQMTSFTFKPSHEGLSKPHVVKDFAAQAKKAMAAKVKSDIGRNWLQGKKALVSEIRYGVRTIDPASFDQVALTSGNRTLEDLATSAMVEDVDALAESMIYESLSLYRRELAMAKVAAGIGLLKTLDAKTLAESVFNNALASADQLIAGATPAQRMQRADVWGDEWGYPAAARKAMVEALKKNAGDIHNDIAIDTGMGALPVIGWLWKAKDMAEELYEVYEAWDKKDDIEERLEKATTVVGLQRAAAELSSAEYGFYASAAVFATKQAGEAVGGKGIDAAKRRIANGPKAADPKAKKKP